tara:strand:- start:494 stop:1903 length:1410 start_codon:yes stop_codon:yes gene_type:complete
MAMPLSDALHVPRRLWFITTALALVAWGCSALRHGLLQSNAYDLGLFDQWVWLIGTGQAPISSMEGVHVLADHGAWLLYFAGAAYRLMPSVQWLLASQALALSFTAIPIWWLAHQAGLEQRRCWLACGLWWLQPVVFNTNLFDVHPETWVMPAFALALWAERARRPLLWLALLILMLGARDGLVLVIGGMALDLAWRRCWRWSGVAAGLALGWLALLSRWLYPWLRDGEGPKAAERMFDHLSGPLPHLLQSIDWSGGLFYLVLLSLSCAPLWRRQSLPTLLISTPLLLVNLLSASASYRTLIHHYSLPLALIAVVAAIDGLPKQRENRRRFSWSLSWAVACWLALAKPWFFTGPYLQRLALLTDVHDAITLVQPDDAVLTTSYLVPQLSQRSWIGFPKQGVKTDLNQSPWTLLLLNPKDSGWGSSPGRQRQLLSQAKAIGWGCQAWPSGLSLCRRPDTTPSERSLSPQG